MTHIKFQYTNNSDERYIMVYAYMQNIYSHLKILFIDPIHMCTVVKCKQHMMKTGTCCKLNIPVVVRKISIQRIKIEDE